MSRAVLVGMPGVGKSTIGRALAVAWGCDFIDLDDLLADTLGVTSAEFLRDNGEDAFRVAEFNALRVALTSDAVVSCGGGTPTYPASRELLEKHPCVIWLDAPLATLVTRVAGGDRPLLGDRPAEALARLDAQRRAYYEGVADFIVTTEASPSAVVEKIVELVGKLSS